MLPNHWRRPPTREPKPRSQFRRPARPRLETLEDRSLPSTFTVLNTADSGAGSLRQAVLDANAHNNSQNAGGVADVIEFDIAADDPGHVYYQDDEFAGHLAIADIVQTSETNDSTIPGIDPDWTHSWYSIRPASALPTITEAVVIDGYTQSLANPNTNGPGLGENAVLRVELQGPNPASLAFGFGLTITGADTTVQGLAINGFFAGIDLNANLGAASGNRVQGNFIGTDVSGTVAAPNSYGIALDAPTNTVGGTNPADRNVIAGNGDSGIYLGIFVSPPLVHDNLIEGNFIGTDASGAVALGNKGDGIFVEQNSGNTIGGTTVAARNIISGNGAFGVAVSTGNFVASDNVIEGNYIGTDVTGTRAVPNNFDGVFDGSSPNTTIGGASPGAGNLISGNLWNGITMNFDGSAGNVVQGNRIGTAADGISPLGNGRSGVVVGSNIAILDNAIAFNGESGVQWVSPGTGDAVLGNAIFSNAVRGISFDSIQVVPNDPGDADTGPNNLQNFPEIVTAGLGSGAVTVTYAVPSDPANSTYPLRIEFFGADDQGHQGQFLLGSDTFTSADREAGEKTVSFVPASAVAVGDQLVATATDAAGNTSEFAPTVTVVAVAPVTVADLAVVGTRGPEAIGFGKPLTYFLAVTNFGPDSATGVTLTDTLPAGVTLVSATPSTGTVTQAGNVLTFALGELASRGEATVVIAVTATATGSLDDRAIVSANESDPDPENNSADIIAGVTPGSLQFSAPTYQINENGGSAVITVTRTGGSTGTVSIDFTTANGTALTGRGSDYQRAAGTLTFNDGETSQTFKVPIVNDALVEGPETVGLTLRNPTGGAALGLQATSVLTIIDNDPEVAFARASSQGSEATRSVALTVTFNTRPKNLVTVDYAAIGGTATGGGVDYLLPPGQLGFRRGQTSAVIHFTVVNDALFERDETIVIGLSSPTNAFLGAQSVYTYTIVNDEPPPDPAGDTQATALPVDLVTMPRQVLTNTLSKSDSDMYRVDLVQGDFLAIDVDPGKSPRLTSRLVITNPDGTSQTIGASPEPDTGVVTGNPATGFTAPATGTYYLLLATGEGTPLGYTLELHRLALAQGPQDPAALQPAGPTYAFLKGNTLSVTGPTGYGFALSGDWQQASTHSKQHPKLVTSTYAATGVLTLPSALGPIPYDVPAGKTFTVTTVRNTFGSTFGEVQSIQGDLEGSLGDFVDPFTTRFNGLGASLDLAAPKSLWQIQSGSQLRAAKGIGQFLDGVPYLTTSVTPSGHIQFGNESFDIPLAPPGKVKPFFAIEPTDPMLYTSFPGVTNYDNVIKDFALAASPDGRIPFVPLHTPTIPGDSLTHFFGHLFVTDTFEIKIAGVPVSFDGAITVNLDANGDGQLLAGNGNADQLLHGDLKALPAVFADIDVGVNGIVDLAVPNLFKIDLQLADVTTVYDGPRVGLWVSGTSGLKDPLAGSALQGFVITNHDVFNAYLFGDGRYSVSFSTRQDLLGTQLGFVVTLDNSGFHTAITGTVNWVVTGGFRASATVTGYLDISVDADTGRLHYAGSVRASGKVTILGGSASFDVGAEVDGDLLVFDLGRFGRPTIRLP